MPLDLSRIRAIIFDIDGTLRDTDDQMTHRLARWLCPFAGLFPNRDPFPVARRLIIASEAPEPSYYASRITWASMKNWHN